MGKVLIKTVAAAPFPVEVPEQLTGAELYSIVAAHLSLEPDKIKVVHKGKALPPSPADLVALPDGAVLLTVPVRAPPSATLRRALATDAQATEDEDDGAHFQLPDDASRWERALAAFLQARSCPDLLLVWLFIVRPRRLVALTLFLALSPVAARYDLGPVFIIGSAMVAIFSNLGSRREGELSAYSIFNPGVQRLPGELDAGDLDQQLRAGHM